MVTNGVFGSMTTLADGDGALPGEYVVTIDTREIDQDQMKSQASDLATKNKMEKVSQIRRAPGQGAQGCQGVDPGQDQLPDTTDLKATVKESGSTSSISSSPTSQPADRPGPAQRAGRRSGWAISSCVGWTACPAIHPTPSSPLRAGPRHPRGRKRRSGS